jgi:hypothetical protein
MYSTTASSSCARVRQTRSAISSVLNESTNDSASAFRLVAHTDRGFRHRVAVVVRDADKVIRLLPDVRAADK